MWNIVWVSPQGHRSVSVSRRFILQASQCPCSVRKWFSRDHCCRGRSKPGCRIVGSQVKLCDLYLSALSVRYYNTGAIYTHLPLVCVKMYYNDRKHKSVKKQEYCHCDKKLACLLIHFHIIILQLLSIQRTMSVINNRGSSTLDGQRTTD